MTTLSDLIVTSFVELDQNTGSNLRIAQSTVILMTADTGRIIGTQGRISLLETRPLISIAAGNLKDRSGSKHRIGKDLRNVGMHKERIMTQKFPEIKVNVIRRDELTGKNIVQIVGDRRDRRS